MWRGSKGDGRAKAEERAGGSRTLTKTLCRARLQQRMTTVSGMLNTDAMNFVECPKCNQPAGKLCTDHRGKKLSIQHPERVAE